MYKRAGMLQVILEACDKEPCVVMKELGNLSFRHLNHEIMKSLLLIAIFRTDASHGCFTKFIQYYTIIFISKV